MKLLLNKAFFKRSGASFSRLMPRKLFRDESGATAVEFGIVALPFFAIIGAILETALVMLAGQVLESAVQDSSRLIRTGVAKKDAYDLATFKSKICDRLYVLVECNAVYVDVKTISTYSAVDLSKPVDSNGNFLTNFNFLPGNSSEIVVVKGFYQFPLVFSNLGLDLSDLPNGKRLIGSASVFLNEPFPW